MPRSVTSGLPASPKTGACYRRRHRGAGSRHFRHDLAAVGLTRYLQTAASGLRAVDTLCATQVGTKRRTGLIGEGYGHHSRLERHLVPRSGREDKTAQGLTAMLDDELDLGSGKPNAIDAPDPAGE